MVSGRGFYITTAIDYPNSAPHIGTAFEKIGADAQARFRRMEGERVTFLMGNDEHSVKVAEAARGKGLAPLDYCNRMAAEFRATWGRLNISFDDFIQTSEPRHVHAVTDLFRRVHDAGFIHKKRYTGLYCEGCESFKTEKDLPGGKCPDHPARSIKTVSEENYFFRLTAFRDELLRRHRENPTWLEPEARRNEILSLLEQGLEDVSISRPGVEWGVPTPCDPGHAVYVWFDALINYLTGAGYGADPEKFARLWPAAVHVIGKDITRFHCVIWPAMLLAAGLPLPTQVFAHGFVYLRAGAEGELHKISKSGKFLAPDEVLALFGGHECAADAYRWYFLRECPFPGDGEFDEGRFLASYHSGLANNLGNLFSRAVNLALRNFEGRAPRPRAGAGALEALGFDQAAKVETVRAETAAFRYHQALREAWDFLAAANQFIDRTEPFKVIKSDRARAGEILYECCETLRIVSILAKPFLPRAAETIYRALGADPPWERVTFDDAKRSFGLAPGAPLSPRLAPDGKIAPLFPRLDRKPA